MTALAAEILAALESPRGRQLLLEIFAAERERTVEAIREILDARDDDQIGTLRDLARWIGAPTPDAAKKRLRSDEELRALAIDDGRRRRWRKNEVLALLSRRRGGAR